VPVSTPEPTDEETLYEGPRFSVHRARFGDRTREWVAAPDAVAVVAYDDERLYLIRQDREAIGRGDILELPAGIMDVEGERPLDTARRELAEEIGMEASDWQHATSYFSSSGFTDEQVHVFLATGLRKVGEPDAGGEEGIELVTWPLDRLDGLIDANADAKTLVGLLWLRRALDTGGPAGSGG
jgi:8-oxo-dGTP pyrophosphatase MutT (NUDIX family)